VKDVSNNESDVQQILARGMTQLGLEPASGAIAQFMKYLMLLAKWGRVYNLTAIQQPVDMARRHILDSLAVMPYIEGPCLLDVGTGPGLPGIPLAVMTPGYDWVLLDSNGKKTRFVTQAVAELGLENVRVVTGRAAGQRLEPRCNTVISRAFADLAAFVNETAHLCADGGQLLAMKGAVTAEELSRVPPAFTCRRIELQVPGLAAQRCIIKLVHK
jgi:16S rRNA (guanine527-N7)-methyltransferase